jgi:hypothetical protein
MQYCDIINMYKWQISVLARALGKLGFQSPQMQNEKIIIVAHPSLKGTSTSWENWCRVLRSGSRTQLGPSLFFILLLVFCLFVLRSSHLVFYTWVTLSALFSFGYFSGRVVLLPGAASDHNPPTSGLPSSWDDRCAQPCLACRLRWGSW